MGRRKLPRRADNQGGSMIEGTALSEDIDLHPCELSVERGTEPGKNAPPSWDYLIGRALDKLSGAENSLRHAVLFASNPKFDDLLIEADSSIRRAISTLNEAHTIR